MKTYPRMLYRTPGPEMVDGVACELLTVADEAADKAAAAYGWHATLGETANPMVRYIDELEAREDLEARATELGLKFDRRTSDKKLAALIAEKLAA